MSKISQDIPLLTVTQLTLAIKHNLEQTFPSIWLQGEVSNSKHHTSGHFYFSLKDARAQIAAVMFRASVSTLKKIPKDGDQVIVYGSLNVYPPSGRYQIVAQELRYAGVGELLLKLEELKQKLHKKGWFSKAHKKPIPTFPKRIGVVTSPTGAAIQDILNILTRRAGGFHLILNPVRVQGDGAAQEISQAIQQFNAFNLVDVMIVGRGGGSIEDLWPFNEESVAEAIFLSNIPIIAAVGHETDHSIAEYVADLRAPTPSAAAELVIAEKSQQQQRLVHIRKHLQRTLGHLLKYNRERLKGMMKQPILLSPYPLLGGWMQKLDDIKQRLIYGTRQHLQKKRMILETKRHRLASYQPNRQVQHLRQRLFSLSKQLDTEQRRQLAWKKERLRHLFSSLTAVDPKHLLATGYSILFSEMDRSVITSVKMVKQNQALRVMLSDGDAVTIVNEIYPRERAPKEKEGTQL
ncbi:MAG: exodeoxyribonuclease VII large subunit [Waddliaceae bacterium]